MQLPYEKKFKKKIKIKKQGNDTFANATMTIIIYFKMKEVMYLCSQEHKFIVTLVSILYLVVTHCNPYLRLIMQSNLKNLKLIWGG